MKISQHDIPYINRMKEKHTIISTNVEEASKKIQHPFFMIKRLKKLGIVGTHLNIIKYMKNPQHISHWWKQTVFPLRSGVRQGCPLRHFYSIYSWKFQPEQLWGGGKEENKRKKSNIQIGKEEVKLYLFANGMILYVENPKKAKKKPVRANK